MEHPNGFPCRKISRTRLSLSLSIPPPPLGRFTACRSAASVVLPRGPLVRAVEKAPKKEDQTSQAGLKLAGHVT